jgi:hypothetical protein
VTSQSGVTVRRLYANKRSRSSLDLAFTNISDAQATAILSCYEAARGTFDDLTLPADITAGAKNDLAVLLLESGSGLKWYFSEPPSVESSFNGRSSVRVRLEATRNL